MQADGLRDVGQRDLPDPPFSAQPGRGLQDGLSALPLRLGGARPLWLRDRHETGDEADFRAQFETNFWGVYHVSKAVVPQLRAQGGGIVVQFSSVGGRVGGSPGIASYQAAKFAVDGFSRVLAVETAPFGVQVMVVEPSGFATDWAGSSMTIYDIPADYDGTIGAMHRRMRASTAGPAGDPARAAEILVQVVKRDHVPSHLLLGVNAAEMALDYSRRQLDEASAWEKVSRSADFAEPYPAEFPADKPPA